MKKIIIIIFIFINGLNFLYARSHDSIKKDATDETLLNEKMKNRFYNSSFRIGLIFCLGGASGNIDSKENEIYDSSIYNDSEKWIEVMTESYGIELDIMNPGLSTRYSIGLRTRFLKVSGRASLFEDQTYYGEDGSYELPESDVGNKIFEHKAIQVGPVFNLILN